MASNEIVITIRARSAVRAGFDAARKEAEAAGNDAGESYTERFVQTVTMRMRERIKAPLARIGTEMGQQLGEQVSNSLTQSVTRTIGNLNVKQEATDSGEEIGDSLGEGAERTFSRRIRDSLRRVDTRIRETVSRSSSGGMTDRDTRTTRDSDTDRDRDKDTDRNLLSRMLDRGRESAQAFSQGFGQAVSTFFSGDLISVLVKVLAGGALVAALGPVIGAAITTAILGALGGGFLAVGIAAAFKDPQIKAAAGDLKTKLSAMFEEFGKPFRGPVAEVMEKLAGFLDRIAPKLQEVAKHMAPVVGALGTGFIALLESAMPGILEAVEASKPLFETLAKHMPAIGKAIGEFFSIIAGQGDDANEFFDDLLVAIEALIPIIGTVIATLTSMYSTVKTVVQTGIDLFNALLGTIKWMASGAKQAFLSFVLYAIDKLGSLLAGASAALGWIPGIGPKLKAAEKKFNEFRKNVNDELAGIKDKTVTIRMRVMGLAAANAAISVGQTLSAMGYAHGGIKGAANGATSSGLTLVGEHGPELAEVKPGGRVWSNPDTQRMLGQGGQGNGGELRAKWDESGNSLLDEIAKHIRLYVKDNGGGNVQAALGR